VINNRYIYDNIPEWELNSVHTKYRQIFLDKLNKGIYKTEIVNKCLCGATEFEQISSKDRFGLPFGNVICKNCGLLLCNPRLKEENLPEFYDKEYHGLVFGQEEVANFEHMVDKQQGSLIFAFLKKYIIGNKNLEIAEIGAGVGNNLKAIIEESKKYSIDVTATGCEYSEACVNFGKEKYGLNMIQGNIEVLLKLNKKFDIVIMSHILEHFINPFKELKIVKSILKENGIVYVEVPGIFDLHNKPVYQCDFLRYSVLAHMYNFSLGTLTNIMRIAGFKLVEGNEFVRSVFQQSEKNKEILNYYNKTIEYLKNQESNRRLFYEFNLNKVELNKIKIIAEGNAALLKDREKQINALQLILKELDNKLSLIQLEKEKIEKELKQEIVRTKEEKQKSELEYEKKLIQAQSEKEKVKEELKQEIGKIKEEKQKSELEFERRLLDARSEKLKVESDLKQQLEKVRADNQAAETWLKEQIIQILNEKKNIEVLLKNQLEQIKKDKLSIEQKLQSSINNLNNKYQELQSRYNNLNYWNNVIINSLSWKITAPIRKIKEILFPKWKK